MPTDIAEIRRQHVDAFLVYLLGRFSAGTSNNPYRRLVALIQVPGRGILVTVHKL